MITLKTLAAATEQEVFDQVATHLLRQNEKSVAPTLDRECAYHGKYGLKCAAGCLIGDDEYDSSMEGMSWSSLIIDRPDLFPNTHVKLICKLQIIHDASRPKDWRDGLKSVATTFGLKWNHDGVIGSQGL